jgi:transposase
VALEVTGSCWEVARILEPHVERVVVVSLDDTGITQARAKTDRLDARALAMLLWRGELEAVWMPDERCRVLRRRLARRQQLVWARTRSKNEIHAVLARRLQAKPPCADLFGVKGRAWLGGLTLPVEERESVDAGIRHIAFLDSEIAAVDRVIARQPLDWPEIRRLMTVTGVNVVCAATFMAAIGHANRFMTARKLVAYLGLDPRSASPVTHRPGQGASANADRSQPGGRWSRPRGRWPDSRGRCTPSMSARVPAAGTARRSSLPPASSRSCSGAC